MLRKFNLYLGIALAGIGFSCESDNPAVTPQVQSATVLNSGLSALTARVKFTLNRESEASVRYWPAAENENNAAMSAVSLSKKSHSIALFQLKEKTAYNYRIISKAADGAEQTGEIKTFTTAEMPAWLKAYYDESKNNIRESLPGYYFLVPSTKPNGLVILDKTGKIAWYWSPPAKYVIKTARFTPKHSLIMLLDENATPMGDGNIILETSLAGDTLSYFKMGEKGFDKSVHHDFQMDSKGNIVAITNEFKNNLPGDGILVLDSQGNKIWSWSTFDELTNIDPTNYAQPWGNSLVIDKDNNYIISLRALSQVWKINATSGKVMWKLGKNGTIKMPAGSDFLFQHFAHRNSNDEIMLFDNGSAARPTTRVLSFALNETTLEATSKINATFPPDLYSAIMGSTMLLPDGNILSASATNGKLIKTDQTGHVIWTLNTSNPIYRAEYIIDPFQL
ncbi:aryl-sulfate sulfotransferase [Dyadobacter crusticola]|uniref:aryl-sulfate sulfotransferase n=1 Tax=Dyadobacter crusticola TaxID=292407 RepID=UPI0004E16813|nr:aryl-sulfate sulfotransferase [Dyadobacter crusticola]